MFAPYELTEDGFESHFAVNYLGHFLLTQLLLPALEEASKTFPLNPRVVNVSSCAHEVAPKINFENINMT
jgi:NAD(P)-dependent dehydrogenase (short-subunit alcohol dehydrogenase family)